MSDFFNPNDFGEWKKVTKAISDHLRDSPNTSNPAKLMHVIADKFGFDDTKAFKAHLDKLITNKQKKINVEALFQLGSYDNICTYIDSEIPEAKGAADDKRKKALWLAEAIAFFFHSRKHDAYNADFSYLNFLNTLKPTEIAQQARLEMKENDSGHPILIYAKNLNIWYSGLPGSPEVRSGEYFWDCDSGIKKSTINAIEREIKPVLWPLLKNSNPKDINEFRAFKVAFERWIEFIISFCRYSKPINKISEKIDTIEERSGLFNLVYTFVCAIDAKFPIYLDEVINNAPHPFDYNRERFIKVMASAIGERILLTCKINQDQDIDLDAELDDFYADDFHEQIEDEDAGISEEDQDKINLFSKRFPGYECIADKASNLTNLKINTRYVFLIANLHEAT